MVAHWSDKPNANSWAIEGDSIEQRSATRWFIDSTMLMFGVWNNIQMTMITDSRYFKLKIVCFVISRSWIMTILMWLIPRCSYRAAHWNSNFNLKQQNVIQKMTGRYVRRNFLMYFFVSIHECDLMMILLPKIHATKSTYL